LFVGSESHPYAVKPSGTVVAAALGLSSGLSMADLQFACKAGTQSLQVVCAYVLAGLSKLGLAIGSDTAQAAPGDALEFSAAAGAAAFLIGKKELLVELMATNSIATDTPDFWRRPGEAYPRHAGRFTGKPAYFKHVYLAASGLMKKARVKPADIDYCVFHTPNSKFPQTIAKSLGFSKQQLQPSLVVKQIGNTYAAASLLAFSAVLDIAKANQTILVTSYGSGSGADSFLFKTTPLLVEKRKQWKRFINNQIKSLVDISYDQYQQMIKEQTH
jgi:hydroxymethylglutaryl-CoA synthase